MRSTILVTGLLIALLLIPAVHADDAGEWAARGWAAIDAKQYTDALTYFNNALTLEKDSSSTWSGKAVTLNALGDSTGALDAAKNALAINANNEKALNARAYALYTLRKYNESVVAYNVLFSVTPVNTPEAYCNQGYAYWQLNQIDNAITSYTRCTTLDPLNIVMWNNLGLVYMDQGNYEKALSSFDAGTSLTVTNATLWNNKGEALVALGRPADALECFKKALGIDPGYTKAQINQQNVHGQLQVYQISETPTPTQPIVRLGTTPVTELPTVLSTPVETPAATSTSSPAIVVEPVTTKTSGTPRTTYSPLSPLPLVLAILGACAVVAIVKSRR